MPISQRLSRVQAFDELSLKNRVNGQENSGLKASSPGFGNFGIQLFPELNWTYALDFRGRQYMQRFQSQESFEEKAAKMEDGP